MNTLIKNIWAVGRNYADHAKELGNPLPSEPMFFLKSGSCIQTGNEILLYSSSAEIHYEVELALYLSNGCTPSHFTLSLDLTNRTEQQIAKEKGLPWTKAKSFRGACVLADWKKFEDSDDFYENEIELKQNSEIRQKCKLNQMIFKPKRLVTDLNQTFPVEPGDVLLTGTPQGVGPLRKGDLIECRIGSLLNVSWVVAFQG